MELKYLSTELGQVLIPLLIAPLMELKFVMVPNALE